MISKVLPFSALVAAVLLSGTALADDIEDAVGELRPQVEQWLNNSVVVEHIKQQNSAHAELSQADIDAMDKAWRAETGAGSGLMIDKVLGNALSQYLDSVKETGAGLYTEIFIMDNKGLNVGQSDVTSDYWQGDEAKWQETFLKGPAAINISEVEFDESTQTYQVQLSLPVVDPDDKRVIGAVTVGINVDAL